MSLLALALVGCTAPGGERHPPGDSDAVTTADTDALPTDTVEPCAPEGAITCPIRIGSLPYQDARDTTEAPGRSIDRYDGCAPTTDESGPEFFYQVEVTAAGALWARISDPSGADVDVHLLTSLDPAVCRIRDDQAISEIVQPGTYFLAVDTYVADGVEQAGEYTLDVGFATADGPCAMTPTDVAMYWDDCAPGIDCAVLGGQPTLHTPAAGPVVGEAHLVTAEEDFPGNGWPTSFTDQIERHYALSQDRTGYAMERGEPWAPAGEGGSEYGQGSGGIPPAVDEAWYVNMYWRDRPARGTRMIVWNPANGRAVVAAGGYETGPGANTAIGGASEEIHDWVGAAHRDVLVMGFAADQDLALGPVDCP